VIIHVFNRDVSKKPNRKIGCLQVLQVWEVRPLHILSNSTWEPFDFTSKEALLLLQQIAEAWSSCK